MADTKQIINCPACGCAMTKIFIPEENINIDICLDGCGGIYFDNRELNKFDERHENIDIILEQIKGKEFKPVDTTQKRICPVCKTPMVKHFMSIKREVEIDDCYACGGKFLDNGELEKIRAQYKDNEERTAVMREVVKETFGFEFEELEEKSFGRKKSVFKRIYDNLFFKEY